MKPEKYEAFRATTDLSIGRWEFEKRMMYYALGIGGESGEAIEKVKKYARDGSIDVDALVKELGDIIWYIVGLANLFDVSFDEILKDNVQKLQDRKKRGKLQGSGDKR